MDPLTIAGLASTGIGFIGSLFGDSREERVERFYNNLRVQAQKDLNEFERRGRASNRSRRRTQRSGSINQLRTDIARRGLAGTTFGRGEVNKAINRANVVSNQAENDFDLGILERQSQVNQIVPPPDLNVDPFGFQSLFQGGLSLLSSSLVNSQRQAQANNRRTA